MSTEKTWELHQTTLMPSHHINKLLILIFFLPVIICGCASQPHAVGGVDVPGFFTGLFHGLLILFSLLGGFFNDDIRVYAFPNSGWSYDLGYVIGVTLFVGDIVNESKKK